MCDQAGWFSSIALDHGSPTYGPSGFIMQPTATFVNYIYIIKITHYFRWLGITLIVIFPNAAHKNGFGPLPSKGWMPMH